MKLLNTHYASCAFYGTEDEGRESKSQAGASERVCRRVTEIDEPY
jgi:hypothetical protein